MSGIPIGDQIECVKREIAMRERVYPTWVDRRRMSKEQADRELGRMRAVLATLQRIKEAMTKPDPMSQALNEGTGTYRP